MPQPAKIEIVIDPNTGQVSYASPLPVPSTVFYLQFVIHDLMARQRMPEEKNIVVPQIIPPARPEG